MSTPRPIIGANGAPVPQPEPRSSERASTTPEMPIAKGLPPWDLVPSDLLLVRRRPVRK